MNDNVIMVNKRGGAATVMLLAFLLFYFPTVLNLFSGEGEPMAWTITGVVMATFYTLVFCINYFKLVPWMLQHPDKRTAYFIINFFLILAICCLIPIWFEATGGLPRPRNHEHNVLSVQQYLFGYLRFIIRDGIMMILSAALAYALRLSEEREKVHRRDLELNAEKRQIELKNLKAQLNPHFLFNSLNNIYALIGFAPERAQKALHDLSSMLRFMIYDSGSSTVALSKEMKFIADYAELMKLRLNSNIRVECCINEVEGSEIQIAPLLFLTLVENAFKHVGKAPDGTGYIKINIGINENVLKATVENTYNEQNQETLQASPSESGVGLENVKKQLQLLYPGHHKFVINKESGIFYAMISVDVER